MRTRSEDFDEVALDVLERVERRVPQSLERVELAVELVPPSDPAPWEPQEVPMSRLFPAEKSLPTRIVLYRRPIETRAHDRAELSAMVNDIVVEQLASALGLDPTDLDPGFGRPDD
ncbi:MAG TPA: metallopeptidase family protein [Dermatophilaceae bacterium]|nr:metallopeptidase family protein [Dermatophilaceae bacterium]